MNLNYRANVMMMTSIVSEELLARDRHIHSQTDRRTHTDLGSSTLKFAQTIIHSTMLLKMRSKTDIE